MASMKAKKGNPFERDCEESLRQAFPDAQRTHETGYILQYDIVSHNSQTAYECKRLKGISWNQLVKTYEKLKKNAPKDYKCYVLFKSKHQPCLVFCIDLIYSRYHIVTFNEEFDAEFKKHTPQKNNRAVNQGPLLEKNKIL